MSDKVISSTTQEFLDVYDIINDMVLLKDGTVSMILQVGTMNFSLLAEEEQDAIIFTYGSLLNSLNYPIQISIQSQTKDVTKYLRLLDEQIQKTSSDRKANLIKQYRDFVATLIKERNVLEKHFYVTIPVSAAEMGLITPSSVLPGKSSFNIASFEKSIILEKAINILEPRRDHLISQFNRLGLYTRQLNTQEIIQNFYINYNPEAAEGQEISSNENYTTPLVRASFGGKIMQTNQPNPTPEEILSNTPTTSEAAQVANNNSAYIHNPAAIDNMPSVDSTPAFDSTPAVNNTPTMNNVPITVVTDAPVSTFNTTATAKPLETNIQTETEQISVVPEISNPEPPLAEVTINPQAQASVDLNLDPSLINGQVSSDLNFNSEPPSTINESTSTPNQAPVSEPAIASKPKQIINPEPVVTSAPEITQTNTAEVPTNYDKQNDFTEEIVPMQNNLVEPQTVETTIQENRKNQIIEPQI